MGAYEKMKAIWKKLGINGQVKNFSSKELWTIENDSGKPIARKLLPGFKTPSTVDCDGFKRVDGKPIDGHGNWWKIYDVSIAEVFDKGAAIEVSAITKTAVGEDHFGKPEYRNERWGSPIQLITDVKRDRKNRIIGFRVGKSGWLSPDEVLVMTCHHEIDNARPVFPKGGRPYVRTRRDADIANNISAQGRV
jgi:hypothetical protein